MNKTWDFSLVGREINERIGAHTPDIIAGAKMSLVCECGDGDCQAFIQLTPEQFHGIRQNLTTFVVTKGHESLSERVLSRNDSWLIVEKVTPMGEYPHGTPILSANPGRAGLGEP
ncbi:MAG: hypothetical protein WD627_12225 [Actinomycetota bacterium]